MLPEAAGESVPTSSETGSGLLQTLSPDPDPLLIQTQPQEVEIDVTQPITLEEAIQLAYRNNPDLQTALLELAQSQADLRAARAALFPTVGVGGVLQGQDTTDITSSLTPSPGGGFDLQTETTSGVGSSVAADASVVYSLYSSGRRTASIQAAEQQVQSSELEVERRREELWLNTVNEYYDLQLAIEEIRINQAFLTEAERNLRDTQLRQRAAIGTQFDVLQAEVQVANARQDLVNSQGARDVAQETLASRLNVPPTVTITTADPVEVTEDWPLTLEESMVLAYQNRAELQQQLLQGEISEQLRRLELSALGPQVNLFTSYQLNDLFTQNSGFNDSFQVGAEVFWTLYDGGAAQARAQRQALGGDIADQGFAQTRNAIRLQVQSAYARLRSNFTNIDTARLAVEQAKQALDLAILRWDAGVGTQLELLTAQSELTNSEGNLVQAIVGYNRSIAELRRATSDFSNSNAIEIP
jgi:outer membrane protein TolC